MGPEMLSISEVSLCRGKIFLYKGTCISARECTKVPH